MSKWFGLKGIKASLSTGGPALKKSVSNAKESTESTKPWGCIMRMDDHGHTYVMRNLGSKVEGERFLQELQQRQTTPFGEGHKQHYWIEEFS
jgi:hypothetical protein